MKSLRKKKGGQVSTRSSKSASNSTKRIQSARGRAERFRYFLSLLSRTMLAKRWECVKESRKTKASLNISRLLYKKPTLIPCKRFTILLSASEKSRNSSKLQAIRTKGERLLSGSLACAWMASNSSASNERKIGTWKLNVAVLSAFSSRSLLELLKETDSQLP